MTVVQIADSPYGSVEVFLDSSYGKRYDNYHNEVCWYFNEQLMRVSQSYDLIFSILSASIPLAYDNIDWDIDNHWLNIMKPGGVFTYDTDYTVSLSNGNYNIKDIKAAVNAQFVAAPNGMNVSMDYSRVTGLATFTSDAPFVVRPSTLSDMLGFSSIENVESTTSVPYTCTGIKKVDIRRTQSLYIISPDVITDSFDSFYLSRSSCLARIPIDTTPYNNVLHWRNTTGILSRVHTHNVNSFNLSIVDDKRRIIKLQRPWCVNIQVDAITHKDVIPYQQRLYMSNGQTIDLPPTSMD